MINTIPKICLLLLLSGCVVKMAQQVKASIRHIEVSAIGAEIKPPEIKMFVRYSTSKGHIIDTSQNISDPIAIRQPKSWVWFIIWPTIGIDLTESTALDGIILYAPGYEPKWYGDIFIQKSVKINLTANPCASKDFDDFIRSANGSPAKIPVALRKYFDFSDDCEYEITIK